MPRGPRQPNSTEAKKKWREYVYSLTTPENCSCLVDEEGKYQYKWLELVESRAATFEQILSTKRIDQSNLIGIDNRKDNIEICKSLFPEAQFHDDNWRSFCRKYPDNDIGVINFDSWNAAHGKDFKSSLNATMGLAIRCKENIGECLVVINVDARRTQSYINKADSREILKKAIEESLEHSAISGVEIDEESMYSYKNSKRSTEMLTCGVLL